MKVSKLLSSLLVGIVLVGFGFAGVPFEVDQNLLKIHKANELSCDVTADVIYYVDSDGPFSFEDHWNLDTTTNWIVKTINTTNNPSWISIHDEYGVMNIAPTGRSWWTDGRPVGDPARLLGVANNDISFSSTTTFSDGVVGEDRESLGHVGQVVYNIKRAPLGSGPVQEVVSYTDLDGVSNEDVTMLVQDGGVYQSENECYNIHVGRCGDGIVDDADLVNGIEDDGNGGFLDMSLTGNEECDPGPSGENAQTCTSSCTHTYCGDGIVQSPNGEGVSEVCDPGAPGESEETCDPVTCQVIEPVCSFLVVGIEYYDEECEAVPTLTIQGGALDPQVQDQEVDVYILPGTGNPFTATPENVEVFWNGSEFEAELDILSLGDYTIGVSIPGEPEGCGGSAMVQFVGTPGFDLVPTSATCDEGNGSIDILFDESNYSYNLEVVGEEGPPTQEQSDLGDEHFLISGVEGGTYTVDVAVDENPFCAGTQTVTIEEEGCCQESLDIIDIHQSETNSCDAAQAVSIILGGFLQDQGESISYAYTQNPVSPQSVWYTDDDVFALDENYQATFTLNDSLLPGEWTIRFWRTIDGEDCYIETTFTVVGSPLSGITVESGVCPDPGGVITIDNLPEYPDAWYVSVLDSAGNEVVDGEDYDGGTPNITLGGDLAPGEYQVLIRELLGNNQYNPYCQQTETVVIDFVPCCGDGIFTLSETEQCDTSDPSYLLPEGQICDECLLVTPEPVCGEEGFVVDSNPYDPNDENDFDDCNYGLDEVPTAGDGCTPAEGETECDVCTSQCELQTINVGGFCGDGIVLDEEECEPNDDMCENGETCNDSCECELVPAPECAYDELGLGSITVDGMMHHYIYDTTTETDDDFLQQLYDQSYNVAGPEDFEALCVEGSYVPGSLHYDEEHALWIYSCNNGGFEGQCEVLRWYCGDGGQQSINGNSEACDDGEQNTDDPTTVPYNNPPTEYCTTSCELDIGTFCGDNIVNDSTESCDGLDLGICAEGSGCTNECNCSDTPQAGVCAGSFPVFYASDVGTGFPSDTSGYCLEGSLDPDSVTYNTNTDQWNYTCLGTLGAENASCTALQEYCGDGQPSIVDGEQCDFGFGVGDIDNGEVCDPEYDGECIECSLTCESTINEGLECGDGVYSPGLEDCDTSASNGDICNLGDMCTASCDCIDDETQYNGECGSVHDSTIYDINAGGDELTPSSDGLCAEDYMLDATSFSYDALTHSRTWMCIGSSDGMGSETCEAYEAYCGDGIMQMAGGDDGMERCDCGSDITTNDYAIDNQDSQSSAICSQGMNGELCDPEYGDDCQYCNEGNVVGLPACELDWVVGPKCRDNIRQPLYEECEYEVGESCTYDCECPADLEACDGDCVAPGTCNAEPICHTLEIGLVDVNTTPVTIPYSCIGEGGDYLVTLSYNNQPVQQSTVQIGEFTVTQPGTYAIDCSVGGVTTDTCSDQVVITPPAATVCEGLDVTTTTTTAPTTLSYSCDATSSESGAIDYQIVLYDETGSGIAASDQPSGVFTLDAPGSYTVQCSANGVTSIACYQPVTVGETPGGECKNLVATPDESVVGDTVLLRCDGEGSTFEIRVYDEAGAVVGLATSTQSFTYSFTPQEEGEYEAYCYVDESVGLVCSDPVAENPAQPTNPTNPGVSNTPEDYATVTHTAGSTRSQIVVSRTQAVEPLGRLQDQRHVSLIPTIDWTTATVEPVSQYLPSVVLSAYDKKFVTQQEDIKTEIDQTCTSPCHDTFVVRQQRTCELISEPIESIFEGESVTIESKCVATGYEDVRVSCDGVVQSADVGSCTFTTPGVHTIRCVSDEGPIASCGRRVELYTDGIPEQLCELVLEPEQSLFTGASVTIKSACETNGYEDVRVRCDGVEQPSETEACLFTTVGVHTIDCISDEGVIPACRREVELIGDDTPGSSCEMTFTPETRIINGANHEVVVMCNTSGYDDVTVGCGEGVLSGDNQTCLFQGVGTYQFGCFSGGSEIEGCLSAVTLRTGGGEANECGDGIVSTGEQCDDGNNIDGDGCDSDCKTEGGGGGGGGGGGRPSSITHYCGDGTIDAGEECDDGYKNGRNSICEDDCTIKGVDLPEYETTIVSQTGTPAKCAYIDPPSIQAGELLPFRWGIEEATLGGGCQDEDDAGHVDTLTMRCHFEWIAPDGRSLALSRSCITQDLKSVNWYEDFVSTNGSLGNPIGSSVLDTSVFRFDEYGEYRLQLVGIDYQICEVEETTVTSSDGSTTTTYDAEFVDRTYDGRICQMNVPVTTPYFLNKGTSLTSTIDDKRVLDGFRAVDGSRLTPRVLTDLTLDSASTQQFEEITQSAEKLMTQAQRLVDASHLGIQVGLKKLITDEVYVISQDITIQGVKWRSDKATTLIVDGDHTVTIRGSLDANVLIVAADGTVMFESASCDIKERVSGMIIAQHVKASKRLINNSTDSYEWCDAGGLSIDGLVIGADKRSFRQLVASRRSTLQDWFEGNGTITDKVFEGAALRVDSSAIQWSTLPPLASDFLETLQVVRE